MPRPNIIRTNNLPYHITSRSNNHDWFNLHMDDAWRIALHSLKYANKKFPVTIHAFVLMNNHYHLLLTTPDANIDSFMQAFNKKFSDGLKKETNYVNRMFGGPYKWSIIKDHLYLYNVYRYIYQNPVRARICLKCEDYKYSTLQSYIHQCYFPTKLKSLLFEEHTDLLEWFNEVRDHREIDAIKRALKKAHFEISKHRDSKYYPNLRYPRKRTLREAS